MTTLVIMSILVATIGIAAAICKEKELPVSISVIVYDLPLIGKYLWSVWVWLMVGLLAFPLLDVMGNIWWQGMIAYATIASLGLVGALPLVPGNEDVRICWHYNFAWIGGLLSQMCVCFIAPCWLMLWGLWAVMAVLSTTEQEVKWIAKVNDATAGKGVFLLEVTAMLPVYSAVLYTLL